VAFVTFNILNKISAILINALDVTVATANADRLPASTAAVELRILRGSLRRFNIDKHLTFGNFNL
jgi:hypothetical protein